jgi:sulfate transport system ATP-binding protein
MGIEIKGINKRFGEYAAIDGVDLSIRSGELLALLGPSGSGKTTLLRIIAGLEKPDAGQLRFDGEDAVDRAAKDRKVGFVFQHYALFRHMSVFQNVAFGLQVKPRWERPSKAEIAERVNRLLSLVQLDRLADRFPNQLSGGQRQRVALARALAIEPRVLLLDEPFGALDAKVRRELRKWLRRLHDDMHITSIFVTHDQEEALELADRVVVMNQGRIEQLGTPTEVYDHPASIFVYDFLGGVNRVPCTVDRGIAHVHGHAVLADGPQPPEGDALFYVRPHQIDLRRTRVQPAWPATIRTLNMAGPLARIEVEFAGQSLEIEMPRERAVDLSLEPGAAVAVEFRHGRVFPA